MNLDQVITELLGSAGHIALVGASNKPQRASYRVMAVLLGHGYRVTPVNPQLAGESILGQTVVASLRDVAEPIDMVDVFRNLDAIPAIVDEAIAVKAKAIWLQLDLVDEVSAQRARAAGLKVVMDRCPAIEIPRLGVSPK